MTTLVKHPRIVSRYFSPLVGGEKPIRCHRRAETERVARHVRFSRRSAIGLPAESQTRKVSAAFRILLMRSSSALRQRASGSRLRIAMLRSGQILNVHVARPETSRTHDERTCQVGLRPRGKGGNLFVARGNPINDLQLPQCLDGPIQRVTDHSINAFHSRRDEGLSQWVLRRLDSRVENKCARKPRVNVQSALSIPAPPRRAGVCHTPS